MHMSGQGFFPHLNFHHAAAKGHLEASATDIVLSTEILAASRTDEKSVSALLRTTPEGLDPAEAEARLASAGPNFVTREGRPSIMRELWGRAKNPLNALLLSLAAVSYFLGDIRAAIVIAIMVVLAITTAFTQEHRSNDAAAKLRAMVKTTASVKRRGAAHPAGEDQSHGSAKFR
jgi:P-type Mg2+ transporter